MADRINKPPHNEEVDGTWDWADDRKAGCGKQAAILLIIGGVWGVLAAQAVLAWT